jgi:hypothetical protein
MPKANKILFVPLLLAIAAYGQQQKDTMDNEESLNRIKFGIGGAWSLYYSPSEAILNEIISSKFDFADGMGLKIGLLLNIPVYTADDRQLVLSPELYYTYRWFDANINVYRGHPINATMHTLAIARIYEHIINVPLLVKYQFLDVMPRFIPSTYIEGGIQLGLPLKTTIENNSYTKAYPDRKKSDFDIIVGAGFGGVDGVGIFSSLRLGYSLRNFNNTFDGSLGVFSDFTMGWFF